MDIYKSCKLHLELASEMRRKSIDSVNVAIEMLQAPDPKKLKAKEKLKRVCLLLHHFTIQKYIS